MGMKDQFQEKSGRRPGQTEEKAGQPRERTGRRGPQERPGQQPERTGREHRDIPDTEQQDRFDQDYDA
ncbi:hypothetical protein ACIQVT_15570 [Streptomyces sp. NPDC100445]|uniref:hypothetical protein n=1 Tax=Streptomyces sp. NPDC100445 TaxID=3366102 RepID=UPI00381D70D6